MITKQIKNLYLLKMFINNKNIYTLSKYEVKILFENINKILKQNVFKYTEKINIDYIKKYLTTNMIYSISKTNIEKIDTIIEKEIYLQMLENIEIQKEITL